MDKKINDFKMVDNFKDFKEMVRKTIELTPEKLKWKPLYPNNMPNNGLNGYYCLILFRDDDGFVCGRKYSIVFQHKEMKDGTGYVDKNEIDRYVLFEKNYFNVKGPLEHPEPSNEFVFYIGSPNTLHAMEVNDYGKFVYAYKNLESAKKRALNQYKAIYGYAMSHLI